VQRSTLWCAFANARNEKKATKAKVEVAGETFDGIATSRFVGLNFSAS
jgi:hypothetical protein